MRVVHVPGAIDEESVTDGETGARTLATSVDVADSLLTKARGLMFRAIPDDYALVFPFEEPGKRWIHMLGVRAPIDVLWVVDDEVVRVETLVPWTGVAAATADTVIELPADAAGEVEPGDTIRVEQD